MPTTFSRGFPTALRYTCVMPVHDWNRVDAATFHAFHTAWITHLSETLNGGVLPDGYYAMPEQHAGRWIADVLTLQTQLARPQSRRDDVGVAVADAPPQVRQRLISPPSARAARRTLAVRHVSGHQIIALIDVVSPANKDRATHVRDFIDKAESALALGIHVLMVDLFAPGPFDPIGMHGALRERLVDEPSPSLEGEPLTLASYLSGPQPEAYLEHLSVGLPLPPIPLFLNPDRCVSVPLESTYALAFRGLPAVWRQVLE
jgi:hypothetical protein